MEVFEVYRELGFGLSLASISCDLRVDKVREPQKTCFYLKHGETGHRDT